VCPSQLRALAKSPWHRPATARTAPVAGLGHQPQHLYYRRRAKARHEAALAHSELCDISASMEAEDAAAAREAMFDRLQWQVAELRTHLDRLAAANAIMAVELSRPVPLVW
jgi:hypothetical protein